MIGQFFSYFIVFFVVARFVSLTSRINWMPTTKTTTRHDVILAIIFSWLVVAITHIGQYNFS
jgi:hypothetical protein